MSAVIRSMPLDELKKSMVSSNKTFADDRLAEVISFWKVTQEELVRLSSWFPFDSEAYKCEYLYSEFSQSVTATDDGLFQCYKRVAKKYAIRHMLGRMNKIDIMYPVLFEFCKHFSANQGEIQAYDYGCGVGDIAIALSLMGFRVRVCELDNQLFDFARWRFKKRGLQIGIDVLKPPLMYPEMPEYSNDVIICREVLEHIRNPLKALERIRRSLKSRGLFYTSSMFADNLRLPGGTHLRESIELASTKMYCDRFKQMFVAIKGIPGLFAPCQSNEPDG